MNHDHDLGGSIREATIPEGIPGFPNPSATAMVDEANAQHVRRSDAQMKPCVVCDHEKEDINLMTAPCGHPYCGRCVNKLFDRATKEESNFPPKCCGETITLEDSALFLSPDIYSKYQERSEEFSLTNRTYCFDYECGTFIPPKANVGDKAKCPTCQRWTCIGCKAAAHEGDCPEDPADQSLMAAAAEAGFQKCQECKRVIELTQGCNHIT